MIEENQRMSPKWETAVKQCRRFRDEIRSYPVPKNKMTIAYLFTTEDLEALLNQAGKRMDGIRAYMGFEELNGKLLPKLHVVGCVKEGKRYIDVVPSSTNPEMLGDALEGGRPCPEDCGTENELNN